MPSTIATSGTRANRARTTSAAAFDDLQPMCCCGSASAASVASSDHPCAAPIVGAVRSAALLPASSVPAPLQRLRGRRGARHGSGRHGHWRVLRGRDVGELPLHHHAKLREMAAARALELRDVRLELPDLVAAALQISLRLGARLAEDELRLALRLLADLAAKLLRAHERVVQRLVALAERAELLVKALRLRLELLGLARQPLELLRDLRAELLHALGIVAAQRCGRSRSAARRAA